MFSPRLTCIGTGTAVPAADRVASGYLIESHGLSMLFDCGPGVVHPMARIGVDWRSITHLCITHFHNDHIGDVPALFFAWKHGMLPARSTPLTVIGPHGTKRLLSDMAGVFGRHLSEPPFELDVIELGDDGDVRLNDVARMMTHRTPHTDESIAFRLEIGAWSFCYTGDTGFSDDVARFAQSVDVLLIECSLPDDLGIPMHLTPSQVAAMARIALPRLLCITHVYPQLDRDAIPGLLRDAGWPGEVRVVHDGDRIGIQA